MTAHPRIAGVIAAAVAVVLLAVAWLAPALSRKLDPADTTSAAIRRGPRSEDSARLLQRVRAFERRACGCETAKCADGVLQEMAMWGRKHAATRLEASLEAGLRGPLEAALGCAGRRTSVSGGDSDGAEPGQ